MKIKAVQTDKEKKYCECCGTWTINIKRNKCININHSYFARKKGAKNAK